MPDYLNVPGWDDVTGYYYADWLWYVFLFILIPIINKNDKEKKKKERLMNTSRRQSNE